MKHLKSEMFLLSIVLCSALALCPLVKKVEQELNFMKMMIFGMEAHFNMKRIVVLSVAVAAMTLTGCIKDNMEMNEGNVKYRNVVVNACMSPVSKTGISAVAEGYSVSWNEGDCITLYECAPALAGEYYWNSVQDVVSNPLEAGNIVDGKAKFSFELPERVGENVEYTYVAVNGYASSQYELWESASEEFYQWWAKTLGYEGEYVEPHMLLRISFPNWQSPSSDSFDPNSDILISKADVTDEQLSGETSFSFARLGTIVRMTLTGLNEYAGQSVNRVSFSCGGSCRIMGELIYDPVLEKYGFTEDSEDMPEGDGMYGKNSIEINPMDVTVKDDGTADIWIRTLSGEVTDWFEVFVEVGDEGVPLIRYVDLEELGRTIVLNEGGMSVFSVGNWVLSDVQGVWDIECEVNETMDGFTASWVGVENAVGYLCHFTSSSSSVPIELTPVCDSDGKWYVTVDGGLAPDNYMLYIKPIPAEGHGLMENQYTVYDFSVGLPEAWWLAHDSFGNSSSCEYIEGTENEYLIPEYSPGKVRYKNLSRVYDSAWQALKATGEWFLYSTEPLRKVHSIEIWSKDDSYLNVNVYASETPNEESVKLEGVVVEESKISAGTYNHTHKLVRYTFPEDKIYQYYTMNGTTEGIIMTSQYMYVYYFK